ncbi:MAG: ribonuclease HII [Gammaproteobacteria bacterium]|nr:ribonuclease HII [Gammaproteobacteria bacterium]|tara:strand:+ start:39300 stop:40280 length:981 start_codon:yes stop_codon:yes gene_type:complete
MSNLKIRNYELLPFDLAAKPIMEDYLRLLDLDISDYTFASNYLWLSNGSGFYSIIDDTFCFFLLTNGDISMLLPPIGLRENIIKAIPTCFNLMVYNNNSNMNTKIYYVDESIVNEFVNELEEHTEIFDLLADYIVERALVDYVYETSDLIELKGNSYSTKRNEINKFRRIHPDHILETLDVEKHADGILELLNKWISDRMKYLPADQTEQFLDGIFSERSAIKRMLSAYNDLGLIGLVIIDNGQLIGFTVGEKINSDTASVIIEKTDFEVLGCAQYVFREFSKVLFEKYQVTRINVGDDMGFENLKKVKMSYRPSLMIPKYVIYKR